MCGFTLGMCFFSTWGEGVSIAMQRKILAVKNVYAIGGKGAVKGKLFR